MLRIVRTWCARGGDVVRPGGPPTVGAENFARVRVPVGKQLAKSIKGASPISGSRGVEPNSAGVPSTSAGSESGSSPDRARVSVRCHSNLQIGLCHLRTASVLASDKAGNTKAKCRPARAHTSSTRLKPRLAEILVTRPYMSHLYQFHVRSGTLEFEFQPHTATLKTPCHERSELIRGRFGERAAFGKLYDQLGSLFFAWLGSFSESIRVRRCCSRSIYTSLAHS